MRTRRFVALVLHLLLLQLTVLGGGMACGGGVASAAPAAVQPTTHAHGGHHAPAPPHEHGTAPTCAMAAGCVAIGAPNVTPLLPTHVVAHVRVAAMNEYARRTAAPAPEPPPPRG